MEKSAKISIGVLIPSFNRPHLLKGALSNWIEISNLKLFIVAEASSKNTLLEYKKLLSDYDNCDQVVYRLASERLGSVNARNVLLDLISDSDCNYILMADDDYILPDKTFLIRMAKKLELDPKIGAIGGRVVLKTKRRDGDFFLNFMPNFADVISRLTGYVFLDVKHGPKYVDFLPPFFMTKKLVLNNIHYDVLFDTPTGFREESDLQFQIRHAGYDLLFDPALYVIHLAAETGGNRPKMSVGKRIYWKARNNTIFVSKWFPSIQRRIWYLLCSALLLSLYRPWNFPWVFKGLADGMTITKQTKPNL